MEGMRVLNGKHPSAEMVYDEIKSQYPSISKATVYRILKNESARGDILAIDVPHDVNRYDLRTEQHYHIKCRACGKVGDVEMDEINILDMVKESKNFDIEHIAVAFSGICNECKSKNESK